MFWHFRVISLVFVFLVNHTISHNDCDVGSNSFVKEGNLGQLGILPWLGVIRVHLHEGIMLRVAVTGAILVKDKYAIANADDIGKIPKKIFEDESKAFFIPNNDLPWTSPLKEYIVHPEYEYSTYNTIALVELKLENNLIPLLPICWPNYFYNTSNQLYALGFTDDNKLLEKVAYQVQYVEKSLCTEFYHRVGQQQEHRYEPAHYQCGYAVKNKQNCVWENGMALVSNSTGTWVLIGLGIRGPGCGAPARFIDLYPYLPWIESLIGFHPPQYPWRKSAGNRGMSRNREIIKDIPLHVFFRSKNSTGNTSTDGTEASNVFPTTNAPPPLAWWDASETRVVNVIDRISKDAIIVSKFSDKYEKGKHSCLTSSYLVYKEVFGLEMSPEYTFGFAYYQLSLYDTAAADFSCIKLRVEALDYSGTYLWYNIRSNNFDDTNSFMDITPPYLKQPQVEGTYTLEDKNTKIWDKVPNANLYLSIKFRGEAQFVLEVWGPIKTTTRRTTDRTRLKGHLFTKRRGKKGKSKSLVFLRKAPYSDLDINDNDTSKTSTGSNVACASIMWVFIIFSVY